MGTLQVFSARLPNGTASATPQYLGIVGAGYTATAVPSLCLWDVTYRAFTFEHATAPGSGKSFTYTLVHNNVDTSVVIVIADLATFGRSVVTVIGAPGDEFYWRRNPAGTPTVSNVRYTVEMAHATAFVSGYSTRGELTNSTLRSTVFSQVPLGWTANVGTQHYDVVAVAGDLAKLSYQLSTAPGAGKNYEIALYLNDVVQDGAGATVDTRVTIADTATTGEWTGALTLAPGDRIYLESTPSGTPANASISQSTTFISDTDGESHCCGLALVAMPTSGTSYCAPAQRQSSDFGYQATETLSDVRGSVSAFVLRSLRIRTSSTISTGPVTFTTRHNAASPAGTPTVTLTSTAQAGHDATGEITFTDGDAWSLEYVATGSPGISRVASWSWAMWVDPNGPPVVDAGPDQVLEWPTACTTLAGSATDDGLPPIVGIPNLIASTSKGSVNGDSVFSTVTTDAIDTTGADAIVLSIHHYNSNGEGPDISDSKSNTWLEAPPTARNTDTTHVGVRFLYCLNPTVGAGHTFTFPSASSGVLRPTITASAWSGVTAFHSDNGTATASDVTTLATGDVSPSGIAAALILSALTYEGTVPVVSGGALDILESVAYVTPSGHEGGVLAYEIQSTGTTRAASWEWTTASDAAVSIVAFGLTEAPTNLTFLWTVVSGPGIVTFDDDTDPESGVCVSEHGVYVLRLTGYDGQLTGFDDVTLTFAIEEYPPACPSGDWGIEINDVDLTHLFKLERVSIDYTLGSAGQLRCLLIDKGPPAAAVRPVAEDVIRVTKGVIVFTGKVVATDETSLVSPNIGTGTTISAVDYQRALSKRLFTGSYGQYEYIIEHPPGHATVTLRSTGDNNDMIFTWPEAWSGANNRQVEMIDPGMASQSLNIPTDNANPLTISLATDGGGAITSTAADIVAAMPAFTAELTADDPSGNDGSGVVAPHAVANYSGGFDRTYELVSQRLVASIQPDVGMGTTTIITITPHLLTTGDMVRLLGTVDVVPDINGNDYLATVVNDTEFTIPTEVTNGGQSGEVHELTPLSVILADIQTVIASYGLTISAPSASGAYVMPVKFTRVFLSSVLKTLTDVLGWVYRVTPYKVLELFAPGDKVAPWTLSTANTNVIGPAPQRRTRENFVNQLFVTGGRSGEIGFRRDTWIANGTDTEFVLPDPDAYQRINNTNATFANRMWVNGVEVPFIGVYPENTTSEWAFEYETRTLYSQVGSPTAPAAGSVIVFEYQGYASFVIVVPDTPPVGEIYNDTFDAGEDASQALAREMGLAELTKRSATERQATLNTFECFTLPGTTIPIDISDRLMANEWLAFTARMQSMDARRNGEDLAKYTYAVLEEGLPTTWVDFWRR